MNATADMSMDPSTRIAIHQGWEANGNVAEEPDWTGTVEEFWEKNQNLTYGDIRDLIFGLSLSRSYPIGGGAAPIFTVRLAVAKPAAAAPKTIADFPAYRIIDEADREFEDGDVIAVPYDRRPDLWSFHTLGSVAAFARKSKLDPDAAVARAREKGEDLYYAFGNGACLTAYTRDKEIVPGFRIGDAIKFAGRTFRIARAPNNNIRLIEEN